MKRQTLTAPWTRHQDRCAFSTVPCFCQPHAFCEHGSMIQVYLIDIQVRNAVHMGHLQQSPVVVMWVSRCAGERFRQKGSADHAQGFTHQTSALAASRPTGSCQCKCICSVCLSLCVYVQFVHCWIMHSPLFCLPAWASRGNLLYQCLSNALFHGLCF